MHAAAVRRFHFWPGHKSNYIFCDGLRLRLCSGDGVELVCLRRTTVAVNSIRSARLIESGQFILYLNIYRKN